MAIEPSIDTQNLFMEILCKLGLDFFVIYYDECWSFGIAAGDRIFLGMQDFDYMHKSNQILPKFVQIIGLNIAQICPLKKLLGDAAASPAPTALSFGNIDCRCSLCLRLKYLKFKF